MTRRSDFEDVVELASEFKVKYDSYDIISKDVSGNRATLKVKLSTSIEGQHLTTNVDTLVFVKEGKEWKLEGTHMLL